MKFVDSTFLGQITFKQIVFNDLFPLSSDVKLIVLKCR